jgi:hypothetical protein
LPPPLRFQPPNPFPAATLPDLDGVERPLASAWLHHPALLVVGHRDCATTRLTLPFVDRIHRRRPAGVAVMAILQDEAASASELKADLGLELPILIEGDPYPVAAELGLRSVPTLFVVGPDGAIRRTSEGFDRDDLEAIARLLDVDGPIFTPEDVGPALRPG